MSGIKWTCQICGATRLQAYLSTVPITRRLSSRSTWTENISYCNDSAKCRYHAKRHPEDFSGKANFIKKDIDRFELMDLE